MKSIKRSAIVLLTLATLVMAAVVPLISLAAPSAVASTRKVDTSTGATPNYRTMLTSDLKSMPIDGGNYTCLKAQAPYTYWSQDWYGVSLDYFLNVEIGMKPDTTAVKFIADDGYSVTLTPADITAAYPNGLHPLLGYRKGAENTTGGNLTDLDNSEGPFRLILPQAVIGPHGVGTDNWNKAVQRVRAIEVQPTPPGMPSFDYNSPPAGQIVVYGNVLNRRTLTVAQLKSIKQASGNYSWMNSYGTTGNTAFIGIPMSFLINQVAGTLPGATGITGIGGDGYAAGLTLDQVNAYYGGLGALAAWNENGADMGPAPGNGPIRLIRPQAAPDDVNTGAWVKNLRVIRVDPLDPALTVDATRVPADRIILCGMSSPENVPNTWYLAEGYTGGGFEEWICIQNPNPWKTHVDIEYMLQGEGTKTQGVDIPSRSRTTIKVNDVVGDNKNVSAKLVGHEGDSIVVERAMYWNNRAGGHCATAVTQPSANWFLAEGCTAAGFETWVLVQNPGDVPANVVLTYMNESGAKAGPNVTMAPHTRMTFNVADSVPNDWAVSTKVTSDQPVIAERAMYWNNRKAGHCANGVSAPGTEWYMAEGCTANGFETWVLLQNPGDSPANATLTYMNENGVTAGPTVNMPPHSRATVDVSKTLPNDFQVSTKVTSDQPVIAERAVYFNNRNGGTCENGVDYPKFKTLLAEGSTANTFESWILIQNPGPSDATVYITYLTEQGAKERAALTVQAGKRVSINESADIGSDAQVSASVQSTTPVAVERAVYWANRVEGSCSKGYSSW
jgi:DMSO/TMAO reductase YedYZ molybdopterin-dependent catalytic subunit